MRSSDTLCFNPMLFTHLTSLTFSASRRWGCCCGRWLKSALPDKTGVHFSRIDLVQQDHVRVHSEVFPVLVATKVCHLRSRCFETTYVLSTRSSTSPQTVRYAIFLVNGCAAFAVPLRFPVCRRDLSTSSRSGDFVLVYTQVCRSSIQGSHCWRRCWSRRPWICEL